MGTKTERKVCDGSACQSMEDHVHAPAPGLPGLDGKKDVWMRCHTIGTHDLEATPGTVARVLEWCFDSDKVIELLEVPSSTSGYTTGRRLVTVIG